jgi:hypothetical protein
MVDQGLCGEGPHPCGPHARLDLMMMMMMMMMMRRRRRRRMT